MGAVQLPIAFAVLEKCIPILTAVTRWDLATAEVKDVGS